LATSALALRVAFETFIQGNDYTGAVAAKDDGYVQSMFDSLAEHWKKGTRGVTDE
jgi:hypothetical protein